MPPLIIVGKCGTKRRLTKQRMRYAGYSGYTRKDGVRQKGSALSIYEGMLIPFLYIPCLILFCRFQINHSGFQTSFIHTQPPSITQMRPQLAINSTSVLSSAQLQSIDKRRNILIGSFHEIHDVFRVLSYHGFPKLPLLDHT